MIQPPITNMSVIPLILLAVACSANQPMHKRSWIKFKDVHTPTYTDIPMAENFNILNATIIEVKEDPGIMSTMIHKSTKELKEHIDSHIESIEKRFKREAGCQCRLRICAKTRIATSVWNAFQPSWTSHIWT